MNKTKRRTGAVVAAVLLALVAWMLSSAAATAEMSTKRGTGTWSVTADGRVNVGGGAKHYGDARNINLWEPIVGITTTQSGKGYWLAARDSGVFSYGDAAFHGNLISQLIARDNLAPGTLTGENILSYLHGEIVDIESTGDGYYLLGKDGGVFTFGHLRFHGSLSGKLGTDATDLKLDGSGGYTIVGANGGKWRCLNGKCNRVSATPPPATTPPPSAAPPTAPPTEDCDYIPCLAPSPDLDCEDVGSIVFVIGVDRHRLDPDGNGFGCEEYFG